MAIIYTYPKLTNPQGNELIVVSDVNNKNATRLITIADIASLVPGGGGSGCATAITGILDGAGQQLYSAVACSEMEIVSSDSSIGITSTATGINLKAAALSCATKEDIGGINILAATELENEPQAPTEDFTIYPVLKGIGLDDVECPAVVKIPNAQSSGGTVTSVSTTSSVSAFTLTTTSASTTPAITFAKQGGTGSDYLAGDGTWKTFPSIPTVNDGILTITVNGASTTFSANQANNASVSITTGGSGSNGFTPMSIYDADNAIGQTVVSTFVQTVVEDTCQINKVDFAATGAVPNGTVIGLYSGRLADIGNTQYLGGGTLANASGGEFIYTIDLIPIGGNLGDTIDITAGDDIVIFYSRPQAAGFHIGKASTGFANDVIAQKVGTPQILEGALNDNIGAILSGAVGEVGNDAVPRLACHFYYEEYTPPADERRTYNRCEDAICDGWTLGDTIVLEASPSLLQDYLILEDAETKALCCFVRGDITTDPVTQGVNIDDTFTDCENLPEVCGG